MSSLANVKVVAPLIMPGDKDPTEELTKGNFSMTWGSRTIRNFKQVKINHVVKEELALPTLYLHFLTEEFRVQKDGETLDQSLRSGNDASEIIVKLPAKYFEPQFAAKCGSLKEHVETVVTALQECGEVFVSKVTASMGSANPQVRFYSLKAARAKATVNLPKKLFGIPENADQYLFVNNHSSVLYYDDSVREAFNECIGGLSDMDMPEAKSFAVFLKVFYEGGFGYNYKQPVGERAFLPISVGVAAMSTVPAFTDQVGIGTGYPYQLPGSFLPFVETVPISIEAIRSMSERHGRYGLCFTRLVYFWEPDDFESGNMSLNYCSILPHGGFYYVPDSMKKHKELGGLVYAFGESKENLTDEPVEQ